MAKNFYLWGWSGQLNAGDDVFAYVVAWGLRHFGKCSRLFMDSDLSGRLSRQCGIHTAQPMRCRIPGLTRLRRAWCRHQADCFVLAGGTLLPTLEGTKQLLADKHWCRPGKSRIALGLSVWPFQSRHHEDAVANLLGSMDHVAFRDDASFDWAVSRKLQTRLVRAFDLAVLLPECSSSLGVDRTRHRVLGISLLASQSQNLSTGLPLDIDIARQVGASAAHLSNTLGLKVVFFSLSLNKSSDDRIMARAFAQAFCGGQMEMFEHNGDPVRTFEKVRSCSYVVSMRLHGGIMAFAAGVPFLQLEYHPKCRDFARTIGLAERHRMGMCNFSPELLNRKLEGLMGCNSVSSVMDLRSAQDRARLNFCGSAL